MKKLLVAVVFIGTSSFCFSYVHRIRLDGFKREYDGTYEFSLKGKPAPKKTWRIKIENGKPQLDFEGAINISPNDDIGVIPGDNSGGLLEVNGKAWCYRMLEVKVLGGKLKSTTASAKVKALRLLPIADFCKGHSFQVQATPQGLKVRYGLSY